MNIPCFDYQKPPPGVAMRMNSRKLAAQLRAAWKTWKLTHDPPAMWTGFNLNQSTGWAWLRFGIKHEDLGYVELSTYERSAFRGWKEAARRVAWSYYDRRASLVRVLRYKGVSKLELWPATLLFWDQQVSECENWEGQQAPIETFPSVLHGLGEKQAACEPQTEKIFPIVDKTIQDQWPGGMTCRVLGEGNKVFTIDHNGRSSRAVHLFGEANTIRAPYWKLQSACGRIER
jgi:hypothetical protein